MIYEFTNKQREYLRSLCTKAAYTTLSDMRVAYETSHMSEEGREAVAACIAATFDRLVRELGVSHIDQDGNPVAVLTGGNS